MGKKLSEMTLSELWQLFPICLTAQNPAWAEDYREVRALIEAALAGHGELCIHHIGSTAIRGVWAKPIVDVLVELAPDADMTEVAARLQGAGFILMSRSETRVSLNRGYTENGFAEKVYHVHLRFRGDNDELYFRDYLNAHPEIAQEYEQLKLGLWKQYEFDRDGYTAAKHEFVRQYTEAAKAAYGKRY